jgi:large subunit ribosomal protein L5
MVPFSKELYEKQVVHALMEELHCKNVHCVPKMEKIVLNMRLNAEAEKAHVEQLIKELSLISGQKPLLIRAKKSISNFKLRKGMLIALKVTLRGNRMYEFWERLVHIVLPVIRDFRGISKRMDKRGNLNIGIEDHSIFPEIKIESNSRKNDGLDIAIVTTAKNPQESLLLYQKLGMVFRE